MDILAACHVHSVWSYDGSWELEALCRSFSSRGYRVLMMTEHDRGFTKERLEEYRAACAKVSSDKILVVPGIEYSDSANRVHVLVWGDVAFLGEGLPTGEMLAQVRHAGGLAVLAHPSRKEAWKSFEPNWTDALLGIEVWNRKYDGWAPSADAKALLQATGAAQFVGLDFHTERQFFPLGMSLDISGEVSESAVLDALRGRRCSARAFKFPVNEGVVRTAIPVLRMVERGRRMGASLVRRARRAKR
jgi:predicted metal-dependent phosphoesterase TrpH